MRKLSQIVIITLISVLVVLASERPKNRVIINTDLGSVKINKNIYGHFAEHLGNCIYGGFWVGEDSDVPNTRGIRNDVIQALREIKPPVIRWPGGCFADYYHWKDGIGPREERPSIINSSWGGVTEDNSFGTHEFLDLCEILGAEPYLCVNVGSGTVQEAADWVEYVNSNNISPMTDLRKQNGREKPWNVKYWAVGNESWGCGGHMTPEYYANLFKRYSTYMRAGNLFRIASGGIERDFHWTETLLKETQKHKHLIDGYSYHYYTVANNWTNKGSAVNFDEREWFATMQKTLDMEKNIKSHIALMDEYDPENKIGLMADEWGNWHDVEPGTNPGFLYQQNTLRDAVTAALFLNIFNNNAKRVQMANIAQTVNVLQAMILTKGEELIKTPTFYVFKMYKVHQDATLLPLKVSSDEYEFDGKKIPSASVSASKAEDGSINISLANVNLHQDIELEIDLRGIDKLKNASGQIISSSEMNDYNDFGKEEKINIKSFSDFSFEQNLITVKLPAKSVVTLNVE